jgi:hypothetical protein
VKLLPVGGFDEGRQKSRSMRDKIARLMSSGAVIVTLQTSLLHGELGFRGPCASLYKVLVHRCINLSGAVLIGRCGERDVPAGPAMEVGGTSISRTAPHSKR